MGMLTGADADRPASATRAPERARPLAPLAGLTAGRQPPMLSSDGENEPEEACDSPGQDAGMKISLFSRQTCTVRASLQWKKCLTGLTGSTVSKVSGCAILMPPVLTRAGLSVSCMILKVT